MAFQIRFDARDRIVHVRFFGRVSMAERLQAGAQVVEKYRHLGRLRILADLRHTIEDLSMDERLQVVDYVIDDQVLRQARIAILVAQGVSWTSLIGSGIAERGHDTRLFLVESEAEAWLREPREY